MQENKDELYSQLKQKINKGVLPAHAQFWKINEINAAAIHDHSKTYNSRIEPDLLYKPLSTFFSLRLNRNEK